MDVTLIRPRLYPEDLDIDLARSDSLGFSSDHLSKATRIARLKRNVFPVLNAQKPARPSSSFWIALFLASWWSPFRGSSNSCTGTSGRADLSGDLPRRTTDSGGHEEVSCYFWEGEDGGRVPGDWRCCATVALVLSP